MIQRSKDSRLADQGQSLQEAPAVWSWPHVSILKPMNSRYCWHEEFSGNKDYRSTPTRQISVFRDPRFQRTGEYGIPNSKCPRRLSVVQQPDTRHYESSSGHRTESFTGSPSFEPAAKQADIACGVQAAHSSSVDVAGRRGNSSTSTRNSLGADAY